MALRDRQTGWQGSLDYAQHLHVPVPSEGWRTGRRFGDEDMVPDADGTRSCPQGVADMMLFLINECFLH